MEVAALLPAPASSTDIGACSVLPTGLIGKTIGEIESLPEDVRAFILRVRRAEAIIEFLDELVIHENDVVAVAARYARGPVLVAMMSA